MLVSLTSGPHSLHSLGCPMGQEQNMGATSSTRAEVHRPGQTEGLDRQKGTAAEKLIKPGAEVRPEYKDGGIARGLGKSLVALIKVQD